MNGRTAVRPACLAVRDILCRCRKDLAFPVLSSPLEYLLYSLPFVKPLRDFNVISRFTMDKAQKPERSSGTKGLIQGIYARNAQLCIVHYSCCHHQLTSRPI